ncbi:hypothetical protein BDF21DRAFT_223475 [Thamnidium elegans]|nr:hypothetical protein BDF21DRAFT_223475 [Thamnidium elegans]
MRILIFTKTQLISLRSISSTFINYHIFPKLAFSLLHQPRSLGGLGILNLLTQQRALQWRWICPLLLEATSSKLFHQFTTPNFYMIQSTLKWFCQSLNFDPLHYLLFPSSRHSFWFFHLPNPHTAFLNIITNFTACLDNIPAVYDSSCHVDPNTCLSLPILIFSITLSPLLIFLFLVLYLLFN